MGHAHLTTTELFLTPTKEVLPVIVDADDGVVEHDDAGQVGGWQGDVVLGSVR
jgi:hypothetical protein